MTLEQRIARTGYVIRYPAIAALAEPERWYLCDENGIIQTRGAGYSETECRAMVERGELAEHVKWYRSAQHSAQHSGTR